MNSFTLVLRSSGAPLTEADRRRYAPSPTALTSDTPPTMWTTVGCIALGVSVDTDSRAAGLGPVVAQSRRLVGVGDVRLDNRDDIARQIAGANGFAGSDLALVLAAIDARGSAIIPHLLGDFAFAIWDTAAHSLLAARDATGIKQLYYSTNADLFAISSRATLLANGERYDLEFIADYLGDGLTSFERSVFAGVSSLPAGMMLQRSRDRVALRQYWSTAMFEIDDRLGARPADQVDHFRSLLTEAVRLRVGERSDVWAALSGGVDSSSIVCLAQELAADGRLSTGVRGTVTAVDTLGDGDEREYVNEIIARYDLRNEAVTNYWMWREDGLAPPLTEGPNPQYAFFARDRRMCDLVRANGGRVLLSGLGADHYLSGTPLYIADELARGHVGRAFVDAVQWAVATRTSFWRCGWMNGVVPLLPRPLYRRLGPAGVAIAPWIAPHFARRFDLPSRPLLLHAAASPAGRKYQGEVARTAGILGFGYDSNILFTSFDLRCPFFYRPLMEFCLQLPARFRTRPNAQKWILREAMRGILPEKIRTRTGKGGLDGRIDWSLANERKRIDWLLTDPIVGELGWVVPHQLRAGVERALTGSEYFRSAALRALGLETWLRVRAGRWEAFAPPAVARCAVLTADGRMTPGPLVEELR